MLSKKQDIYFGPKLTGLCPHFINYKENEEDDDIDNQTILVEDDQNMLGKKQTSSITTLPTARLQNNKRTLSHSSQNSNQTKSPLRFQNRIQNSSILQGFANRKFI